MPPNALVYRAILGDGLPRRPERAWRSLANDKIAGLLPRRERLIGIRRADRTPDHDEAVAGALVAGIAGGGQLVERCGEFRRALRLDGRLEVASWPRRVVFDHLADRQAVVGREIFDRVVEALLKLVELVGREIPVLLRAGEPQLEVPHLRQRHDLAEARPDGWLVVGRAGRQNRREDERDGDDVALHEPLRWCNPG